MNNIKEFFRNYGRYLFIFVLVFLIYEWFGYGITYGDPIANYGFSYAIKNGQIPYLDFNTISTPLYAFIMSIGLHFFDNYLMFILEQSLLVTIMFYFLFKLFDKKSYFILFSLIFFGFYGIIPTYNFCCFLLLAILLYLEKFHNDEDWLIGIFIGLSILTKHTVGGFFVLPTIIMYFKDYKKILRRAFWSLLVGLLFIEYLICNGTFYHFFNLCFGGLLDFGSSNGNLFNSIFFICLIMLGIMIYILIKDKKNILNWYLVFTFMFVFPLFDMAHFGLYLGCFTMMIMQYIKFNNMNYVGRLGIILCITICLLNIRMGLSYEPVFMKGTNRFNFTLNSNYSNIQNKKVDKYFKEFNNPLIISYHKMFYDISNGNDLDYYDVIMYGNFGYDGINRMINDIKSMNDRYIIVDMNSYNKDGEDEQFAKEIADYVIKNCKKIDSKYGFDVYYKK